MTSLSPPHRHRREQKQRHGPNPSTLHPSSTPNRPVDSHAEALNQRIRRLDSAKRRVRVFNKVALCVATLCVGNSVFTKLSNRRHGGGGGASVLGEAFQPTNDTYGKKKQRNNNRLWPFFGNLRRSDHFTVPKDLLQPFGSYPNVLNITTEMRKAFHPVVKIPLRKGKEETCIESELQHRTFSWPWQKRNKNRNSRSNENDSSCIAFEQQKMNETYDYIVKDFTGNTKNDNTVLLQGGKRVPQLVSTREEALEYAKLPKQSKKFDVGRYDEDRRGMYTSSLFLEGGNTDEKNRRTVHVGIDIGAPVGTSMYAFEDGIVHSLGYNAELGDYGHVIVIEHAIIQHHHRTNHNESRAKVYALYGHLGAKSIQGKYPGQSIQKGQVIGYVGNTAENGGWTGTHVHFQLAVHPPETHDMPGAVALVDREEALMEYLDPRYVLGELY